MIRTRLQGDVPFFPNMLNNGKVEVCLKDDVDKVIVEKDEEIAELEDKLRHYPMMVALLESNRKEIAELKEKLVKQTTLRAWAELQLRHQKYKRCLGMAKICENKLGTVVKPGWWDKWWRRWLELAGKLRFVRRSAKEAK